MKKGEWFEKVEMIIDDYVDLTLSRWTIVFMEENK